MIYITGDKHGQFDNVVDFCYRMKTNPADILIILGDAGINFSGGYRDQLKKEQSPIFDFNVSLLPYVSDDEFEKIGDRLFEYSPKLGEDFTRIGQMGMNDILRDRVKDMEDFSFSFRGDDVFSPRRVEAVEDIVRKQARAVLSKDKLYTKDVFFSQKAQNIQCQKDDSRVASELMQVFLYHNVVFGR